MDGSNGGDYDGLAYPVRGRILGLRSESDGTLEIGWSVQILLGGFRPFLTPETGDPESQWLQRSFFVGSPARANRL